MPLENATKISELDPANPLGSDSLGAGDDHIRMIKNVLKNDQLRKIEVFNTMADAVAEKGLKVGQLLLIEDRGGSLWDVVDATIVTPNGFNIVASTADSGIALSLKDKLNVNAETFGAVADGVTDNTSILQGALDSIQNVDIGIIIKINRGTKFNLKKLVFNKRQTLVYFIDDDISNAASQLLGTNELVTFQANANNAGIVNEERFTASFHPGFVVDVRKDVSGHDAFLGAGQARTSPSRASYNIADEQLGVWRVVWENYDTASDFTGVKMHYWAQRVTLTGITTASFTTVPVKGEIVTGAISGAKGRLYSIDANECKLTWISGSFEVGEAVTDADETSITTIATESIDALIAPTIGWNVHEGQLVVGLPTNMTNGGYTLNIGGKIAVQNTRSFGQIQPAVVTSPAFAWVDDWDSASPTGLEVEMDTTVATGTERLQVTNLGNSIKKGLVGALSASTQIKSNLLVSTSAFNVASITNPSTGVYTVTFKNPLVRADYVPQITIRRIITGMHDLKAQVYAIGTDSCTIRVYTESTASLVNLDADHSLMFSVFCGDI